MTFRAKDIMVTQFDKIDTEASVEKVINMILNGKTRETGHKTISLMVIDEFQKLAGIVTMYDILYHLRPSFLNLGFDGDVIPWDDPMDTFIKELKDKKVHKIMTRNIVGASPEEHLMAVLDRMVKNKYRRLPILENHKPIGIVYLSDIYFKLFHTQ